MRLYEIEDPSVRRRILAENLRHAEAMAAIGREIGATSMTEQWEHEAASWRGKLERHVRNVPTPEGAL